jgi:hypothetical protein
MARHLGGDGVCVGDSHVARLAGLANSEVRDDTVKGHRAVVLGDMVSPATVYICTNLASSGSILNPVLAFTYLNRAKQRRWCNSSQSLCYRTA